MLTFLLIAQSDGTNWALLGGASLAAYVLGVLTTPLAGRLVKWALGPKLSVAFDRSSCFLRHKERREGPTGDADTTYRLDVGYCKVRLKVANTRRRAANNCRAQLVRVERRNAKSGAFEDTHYHESLPLAWVNRGGRDAIDLPRGKIEFVDVVATDTMSRGFVPGITVEAPEYENLWRDPGLYRLTVQVTADGADAQRAQLLLDWKGHWENFEVNAA